MAITRAQVEGILVKRASGLLTELGLSTAVGGSNTDLNDPIGYAIRKTGGSVDNIALVDDADLSGIAAGDYDQLLDVAELRLLMTLRTEALKLADTTAGPRSDKYSQIAAGLQAAIAEKRQLVAEEYGTTAPEMTAGVITPGWMETNPTS